MSPRNHSYFQDLLEQHVSGTPLPPEQRMDLFDHIEDCDDCREMLEAEERITARMKSVPRLVAPSDLRSRILSQAIRDHRERTTTPSEDPAVADLLKSRSPATSGQPDPAAAPATQNSRTTTTADSPHHETMPVFAGVALPRPPGRFRRTWRRASPVLASGLLCIGAVAALYSGPFQGVPVAEDAQRLVWAGAHALQNYYAPGEASPETGGFVDRRLAAAPPSEPHFSAKIRQAHADASSSAGFVTQTSSQTNWRSIAPHGGKPLPGTDAVVDWMQRLRGWGAALDSTAAALAQASVQPVPAPAEKAPPQIASLILRPTDRGDGIGGFHNSALADTLEDLPRNQPGCRIARQDQFTMDGHRYRLYVLELPTGYANQMVQTLTPYESPADFQIVTALSSQDARYSRQSPPEGAIQFYSSEESRLKSALEQIVPVSAGYGRSDHEQLQVVLVE